MALTLQNLQPFKSLLLAEITGSESQSDVVAIKRKMVGDLLEDRKSVTEIVDGGSSSDVGNLDEVTFFYYKEQAPTPWTNDPDFIDLLNHLAVICRRGRQLAIYCSDPVLLARVRKAIALRKKSGALLQLALVPAGRINAAFVSGETQALWLSGTHRRVASKVDNKVLTGLDLRYALDPLGDQSYFFTAARCRTRLKVGSPSLGISPRKSSIWAGRSADWNDFAKTVSLALRAIASQRRSKVAPFPVLAVSVVDKASRRKISNAYDAGLIPPEIFEPTSDEEARRNAERWSQFRFEVRPKRGADFSARILRPADTGLKPIGTVQFAFDLSDPATIDWEVTPDEQETDEDGRSELDDVVRTLNEEKKWLKIWYESGHVLAEQDIFQLRFREFPFRNYLWDNFGDYYRDQEKPKPLNAANIGRDKSLFSWVKSCWRSDLKQANPNGRAANPAPGWLASNDGSMEIADFIHLNDRPSPAILTLIHVKGANNNNANRPISVSAYEIVTSQAVKNLRHIDEELLAGNFVNQLDKRIKEAVWYNGRKVDRERMLEALSKVNANYIRRVIILQPQTTRSSLVKARDGKPAGQLRAKQLDTLLLAAQANCQSLGAEFYVIGDKT
jgi:hypothetical protein